MRLIVFLCLFYLCFFTQAEENYCYQELCERGVTHVGCLDHNFARSCGVGNKIRSVNSGLRALVLAQLNTFRNAVASGLINNMKAAVRMPMLSWDKKLAHLASLQLRKCNDETYCDILPEFSRVITSEIKLELGRHALNAKMIGNALGAWFLDIKGCKMDEQNHIVPVKEGSCVGHYIPIIQDQGYKVGCSLMQTMRHDKNASRLICNFGIGKNFPDDIYQVAEIPASGCVSGQHTHFRFLCSNKEVMNS